MRYDIKALAFALFTTISICNYTLFAEDNAPSEQERILAESNLFTGFQVNTKVTNKPFPASELSAFPIAYRAGESVTYVAPDGTTGTLGEESSEDKTCEFNQTIAGLWRIINSNGQEVQVGIPWNLSEESWFKDFPFAHLITLETIAEGPDRKVEKEFVPAVSFSGDHWRGDALKPAKLIFTPPATSGLEETTLNLTGTGAAQFTFSHLGLWKITLIMDDESVHTADIFIRGGFTIYIR